MFPMGCIGWRIATTAPVSEVAAPSTAMEASEKVATIARRRVRVFGAFVFMGHFLVRAEVRRDGNTSVTTGR
jgi:hypothetical protein